MAHDWTARITVDPRNCSCRGTAPSGARSGGADPAATKKAVRQAATVSELCDLYLKDAEAGRLLTRRKSAKKTSTLLIDRGRIERHIKPLIGAIKLTAITQQDIDNFMHDVAAGKTAGKTKTAKKRGLARVRGGRGAASRAVGLLGGIFTYAVRRRMRPDNPVHGVVRFADGKRERRLTEAEYSDLGEALRKAEIAGVWPPAIAAASPSGTYRLAAKRGAGIAMGGKQEYSQERTQDPAEQHSRKRSASEAGILHAEPQPMLTDPKIGQYPQERT